MKRREGRERAERERVLPRLQEVCSSYRSSSTFQASRLPCRPDTLRTTRGHRACHDTAARPPADSARPPSLTAPVRVSACIVRLCLRPQATPSMLLHNLGPSPPTSSAVLPVPPPSRHGGGTSARTARSSPREHRPPHTAPQTQTLSPSPKAAGDKK